MSTPARGAADRNGRNRFDRAARAAEQDARLVALAREWDQLAGDGLDDDAAGPRRIEPGGSAPPER